MGWFLWHVPSFPVIESYRAMTLPVVLLGFLPGICAGSLVLVRVTSVSGGSVLAAALWHLTYNLGSATAAATGPVAAVVSTLVTVWAVLLLVQELRMRRSGGSLLRVAGP